MYINIQDEQVFGKSFNKAVNKVVIELRVEPRNCESILKV